MFVVVILGFRKAESSNGFHEGKIKDQREHYVSSKIKSVKHRVKVIKVFYYIFGIQGIKLKIILWMGYVFRIITIEVKIMFDVYCFYIYTY